MSPWQGRDDPQAKRKRLEELLEALAVVKWGYCGALEERSLCDAFNVDSQFGFGWEDEADDADTANAAATGGGGDKEGPQTYLALDNETPLAISEKLGLDLPALLEFNVPLGSYLIAAGCSLAIVASAIEKLETARVLQMHDAWIEQQHQFERFREFIGQRR